MIKAIFFDIDGTLVSFKTHRVPASTLNALRLLRDRGIKLFIATGRHKKTITDLDEFDFDGYITLNGGICMVDNETIYKHSIPNEDINALIDYIENVEPIPCVFVQENQLSMNYKDEATEEIFSLLNYPDPPLRPLREIEGKTVFQILAFFRQEQEKHIMPVIPHCETTRWNPLFTDVVPSGSSKWVGIMKTLEQFQIDPEETMAFGDGGNDIQMLKNAGIGVAMGNSEKDVKQYADYVTDSVDDDGIWNALKHFGLIH